MVPVRIWAEYPLICYEYVLASLETLPYVLDIWNTQNSNGRRATKKHATHQLYTSLIPLLPQALRMPTYPSCVSDMTLSLAVISRTRKSQRPKAHGSPTLARSEIRGIQLLDGVAVKELCSKYLFMDIK